MRKNLLPCFALLAATSLAGGIDLSHAAAAGDERPQVCAEADERYRELFGEQPSEEGVVVVKMYKYTFCPPELEVPAGTTVRWVNVDKRTSHSVWFQEQGEPESERLFSEESVEKTFDMPGSYPYICGPHGEQQNMRGAVGVTP